MSLAPSSSIETITDSVQLKYVQHIQSISSCEMYTGAEAQPFCIVRVTATNGASNVRLCITAGMSY